MRRTEELDIHRALDEFSSPYSLLQWKTELRGFVQFLVERRVKSFLEVGCFWGQLSLFLKDVVGLERVYACDLERSPLWDDRPDVPFYHGDHQGPGYPAWRRRLGAVDMVFIDADHETGFRRDYEIERSFPHRFVAFHDVANRAYPALRAFWEEEVEGEKVTFVNRDPDIPFGVPPLRFPFGPWRSAAEYEALYGRCCGIGVSWIDDRPAR